MGPDVNEATRTYIGYQQSDKGMNEDDRARPLLLRADNFTPPQRTPWGGTRVAHVLKENAPLSAEKAAYACVGESWEVSVEPDFPSFVENAGNDLSRTLAAIIAEDPYAFVGREALRGQRGTALLVKLLDTADELSVQIHPADDYGGLRPGECGKPESWYVVTAEPGAGIYLGLADGVTRESLTNALASAADLTPMLGFVPVQPGDFFLIEAGTPHAIGRGLVLVEPQHVAPGKRGLTYRYWDWNRRYDANGVLVSAEGARRGEGEPRALHVDDALAVTRWDAPRGMAFAELVRLRAGAPDLAASARLDRLAAPTSTSAARVAATRGLDRADSDDQSPAPLASAWLDVSRIAGCGALAWPAAGGLVGLTVVAGSVTIVEQSGRETLVARGRSAVLPACIGAVTLRLELAHAVLASIP